MLGSHAPTLFNCSYLLVFYMYNAPNRYQIYIYTGRKSDFLSVTQFLSGRARIECTLATFEDLEELFENWYIKRKKQVCIQLFQCELYLSVTK